jgi:hypothetical protein
VRIWSSRPRLCARASRDGSALAIQPLQEFCCLRLGEPPIEHGLGDTLGHLGVELVSLGELPILESSHGVGQLARTHVAEIAYLAVGRLELRPLRPAGRWNIDSYKAMQQEFALRRQRSEVRIPSGAPPCTHLRTEILARGVGQDGAFEDVLTALDANACVINLHAVDE